MSMIFDAHCDTVDVLYDNNARLKKNKFHLDIVRMSKYEKYIQIFAAYIDKKRIKTSPKERCVSLLNKLLYETENDDIRVIKDKSDLYDIEQNGGIGAIFSIEGGEALEGDLSAIDMYRKMGVRLITLTWNYANELADGIAEPRGGGLTDFGKKAVKRMEELGILVDVSHLSVNGFWDVAEIAEKPFTASHSCVKALCNNPRNLDDEQIKFMIDRDCVIGMNFYPKFINGADSCDISDLMSHMKYIISMGGAKNIGFGSDFDGVDCLPRGICGVEGMSKLISHMHAEGLSGDIINDIAFNNFLNLFKKIL